MECGVWSVEYGVLSIESIWSNENKCWFINKMQEH
jgi:hypothetical protein